MFRKFVLLAFCVPAVAGWCEDAAPASWEADLHRQAESASADGRWLEARNAWTKLLAWEDVAPSMSPDARVEAERRAVEAEARWRATLPPPAPSPLPAAGRKKRESPRASRRRSRPSVDGGATAKEIMSRARAARDAGQLESALRLYRLAADRPGGDSARRAAAEVAAEMGEPQVER